MNLNSKQTPKKNKIPKKVDRVLLGPLNKDTDFLKGLMKNKKFIVKKKNMYGEEVRDACQDEVKKIFYLF